MRVMVVMPTYKGGYPKKEEDLRVNRVLTFSRPGLDVEVGFLDVPQLSAWKSEKNGYLELILLAPWFVKKAIEAEKEGFDAVTPFGMLDIGAKAAKYAVNIPVVAPSEATYHLAALMGKKGAAIVYHENSLRDTQERIKEYGMSYFIKSVRPVGFPLQKMSSNKEEVKRRFVRIAREEVEEKGVDIIISNGYSMCPILYSSQELAEEIGVPVIDGLSGALGMAEIMVKSGLTHSRLTYPLSASRAVISSL